VQIGVAALQTTDVMQVAPELLRALLQMAGEAVNLAVFDADSMVLLYREQGPQSITISSRLGSHRPMHASALGKAFLSAMAEAERRVLLGRISFKRYTDTTITSLAALEREIAEIQAKGYAVDRSEFETTLACAAAPIFDHRGLPVAAISVSGPAERVMPQIERIGGLVGDTARATSIRLGYVRR
jgi:DNA-binding IclR family transcriptional regulator